MKSKFLRGYGATVSIIAACTIYVATAFADGYMEYCRGNTYDDCVGWCEGVQCMSITSPNWACGFIDYNFIYCHNVQGETVIGSTQNGICDSSWNGPCQPTAPAVSANVACNCHDSNH